MNRFALIVAGAVALAGFSTQIEAQSSTLVAQHTTQTWLIKKGSPDFNRVRAFLVAHSGFGAYPISNVGIDRLGDLTLEFSSFGRGSAVDDQNNPPDQPPGGNYPLGSTWSISTCIGTESQTWTWTAESNGHGGSTWVQTSYSDQKGTTCSPNKRINPPGGN